VLVAVRNENLGEAVRVLEQTQGGAAVLYFGNNPRGRARLPHLSGPTFMGFPAWAESWRTAW
jgi:hypothetical protein